jgi:hypothetical protein
VFWKDLILAIISALSQKAAINAARRVMIGFVQQALQSGKKITLLPSFINLQTSAASTWDLPDPMFPLTKSLRHPSL